MTDLTLSELEAIDRRETPLTASVLSDVMSTAIASKKREAELEERLKEAREALRPFANLGAILMDCETGSRSFVLNTDHLRTARQALSNTGDGE